MERRENIGFVHEIDVYSRFSETDATGNVGQVSYFNYFEEARSKFFKELRIDRHNRMHPFIFMLVSIKCDYLVPVHGQQTLKVITKVERIGTKSFTVGHTLMDKDKTTVIAKAQAISVCFNYEQQQSVPFPNFVRDILEGKRVAI